ncbi:hypothetical protein BDR03DRAFT_1012955 [Suillus americanus]|nr:hypothetical protein BDR03DRAFT_1012955 [Suillus americanus]
MTPCKVQGQISPHWRRQIVSAAASVVLCTQFQLFLMTQKKSTKPTAQWSEEGVDVLLTYLQSQVAKITATTFKEETFNGAAKKIAEHHAQKGLQNQGDGTFQKQRMEILAKDVEDSPKQNSAQGVAAYKPASLATTAANVEASGFSSLVIQPSESLGASGLETTVVLQVGWDQIESPAGSSMNMPPPPSSVAPSTTIKCTHSDMVLSASAIQNMTLPMGPPNVDKKLRLSTYSSSNIVRSRKSSKAAKDAASTAIFMNLQHSLNHLTDSLHIGKGAGNELHAERG